MPASNYKTSEDDRGSNSYDLSLGEEILLWQKGKTRRRKKAGASDFSKDKAMINFKWHR